MESQASADQVLPQVSTLAGFELRACVIEIVIFDKSAELRIPIVIRAGDNLPRKVSMALPAACPEAAASAIKIESGGFRIIDADTGADVGLEPVKGELPEVAGQAPRAGRAGWNRNRALRHGRRDCCP